MSMTITLTPQEELRRRAVEAQELHAKGRLEGQDAIKMAEHLTRMQELREEIERGDKLGDLTSFAAKSSGMIPLAAGNGGVSPRASVTSITPAGTSVFQGAEHDKYGTPATMELLDQYGEGIWGGKALANTTTDEYREAFKSYVRKGASGLKVSELKTLQESVDTSGGFAVPCHGAAA